MKNLPIKARQSNNIIAEQNKKKQGITTLLKPYAGMVRLLLLFAPVSNGLNLWLPKIIGNGIDAFNNANFSARHFITFIFNCGAGYIRLFLPAKRDTNLRVGAGCKGSANNALFSLKNVQHVLYVHM